MEADDLMWWNLVWAESELHNDKGVGEADILIALSHPDLSEQVTKGQKSDILGDW